MNAYNKIKQIMLNTVTHKNTQIMKKLVSTIILMVLFTSGTIAQSELVYNLPNLLGENSIVRQCGNDTANKYLLYTEGRNLKEYFTLIDSSTQTHPVPQVELKQWYRITDFAVREDTAFFIGVYKNSRGFWGYFNIPNVFYGGDTITYFMTNSFSTKFSGPHGDDQDFSFVNFDELQIIPLPGRTELLLTGSRLNETYEGGILKHFSYTPCLFHVTPPYTDFEYAYNTAVNEKFDDVFLIGNNVIVVGRENHTAADSANILIRFFNAPNFSFHHELCKDFHRQQLHRSLSKVLIESIGSIGGNQFAIVYYGTLGANQGLHLETYHIGSRGGFSLFPILTHSTFVSQGNTLAPGCTIRETAFNQSNFTLCVLQDMIAPPQNRLNSVVCKFDFSRFPDGISCSTSYRTDDAVSIHSVTDATDEHLHRNSDIMYSGKRSAEALVMRESIYSPASCMHHGYLPTTNSNTYREIPSIYMPLTEGVFTATRIPFHSAPRNTPCNVLCIQY